MRSEASVQFNDDLSQIERKAQTSSTRGCLKIWSPFILTTFEGADMSRELTSDDRIMKLREVCAMTGLSRSSIYELIKKGSFPSQVKLSVRSSGWFWSEVKGWLESRPRGS